MLNEIGINEQLANNLFIDLELNKTELEKLIKSNMDEKFEEIIKEKNEIEINSYCKIRILEIIKFFYFLTFFFT
jgi:hypothetical protein